LGHDIVKSVSLDSEYTNVFLHSSDCLSSTAPPDADYEAVFLLFEMGAGGLYNELSENTLVIENRHTSYYPPFRPDYSPRYGWDIVPPINFLTWRVNEGTFEQYLCGKMPFEPPFTYDHAGAFGVNDFEDAYLRYNDYLDPVDEVPDRTYVVAKFIDVVEAGGCFVFGTVTGANGGRRFPFYTAGYSDSSTHLDIGDWISRWRSGSYELDDLDAIAAGNVMDLFGAGYLTLFDPASYTEGDLFGYVYDSVYAPDSLTTMSCADMMTTTFFPEYPNYWLNNPAINIENSYPSQPTEATLYVGPPFIPGYTGDGFDSDITNPGVDPSFNGEDIKFPSSLDYEGNRFGMIVGKRTLPGNAGAEISGPRSLLQVAGTCPYVADASLRPDVIEINGCDFGTAGTDEISVLVWPATKLPPIKLYYQSGTPNWLEFVINRGASGGNSGCLFGDTVSYSGWTYPSPPGGISVAPTQVRIQPTQNNYWDYNQNYEGFYEQVWRNFFPSNALYVQNPKLIQVMDDIGGGLTQKSLYQYYLDAIGWPGGRMPIVARDPLGTDGGLDGARVPPFYARELPWQIPY